jgi:hypothetical protein
MAMKAITTNSSISLDFVGVAWNLPGGKKMYRVAPG